MFELASEEDYPRVAERIRRVRADVLPSAHKLELMQKRAQRGEISTICEDQLVIESQGENDRYWLEFEQTGVRVGCVGLDKNADYRLLWLIDGRTLELFMNRREDTGAFYADGKHIGAVRATDYERFLLLFHLPIAWEFSIESVPMINAKITPGNRKTMLVHVQNREACEIPIGELEPPSLNEDMSKLGALLTRKKKATKNQRWLLPRAHGFPLCSSPDEMLALTAFSLQFRQAYWSLGD